MEPNGSDFVVVANRLPVDMETLPDGTTEWTAQPRRARHRSRADAARPRWRLGRLAGRARRGARAVRGRRHRTCTRSRCPRRTSSDYYEGFSNATLWPLYHDVVAPPVFDRRWWEAYVEVNERFAEAAAEVAAEGATVWVQDYQLQLVPAMLRERRPDLRIGFFLHIPFPPTELFMQLPWRERDHRGPARRRPGRLPAPRRRRATSARLAAPAARPTHRRAARARTYDGRTVQAGAFPISIDVGELEELAPHTRGRRSGPGRSARELGDPSTVILGVDRLDYTKGIDVRLRGLRGAARRGRLDADDDRAWSRSRRRAGSGSSSTSELRDDVERQVGRINGDLRPGRAPGVHYLHQSCRRDELVALYLRRRRHAGHAAARRHEPGRQGVRRLPRYDDTGALVLSEFAGAAAELRQAFLVNPHDVERAEGQ